MLHLLTKLANLLDQSGCKSAADEVDTILKRSARIRVDPPKQKKKKEYDKNKKHKNIERSKKIEEILNKLVKSPTDEKWTAIKHPEENLESVNRRSEYRKLLSEEDARRREEIKTKQKEIDNLKRELEQKEQEELEALMAPEEKNEAEEEFVLPEELSGKWR